MKITGLQHFNITAPFELIERVRDFYVEVLGLKVGERPGFRRAGFWLYAGREPLVHLTVCDDDDARRSKSSSDESAPGFFDHLSFACEELSKAKERLERLNIPYEVAEVASLGQVQLFIRDPAGTGLELNFDDERAT